MDDVKFSVLIQMSKVSFFLFCVFPPKQFEKHEYKCVQCLDTGMFQALNDTSTVRTHKSTEYHINIEQSFRIKF